MGTLVDLRFYCLNICDKTRFFIDMLLFIFLSLDINARGACLKVIICVMATVILSDLLIFLGQHFLLIDLRDLFSKFWCERGK